MRHRGAIFGFAYLALMLGCARSATPSAQSETTKGAAAADAGYAELALAFFNAALRIEPDNADALSRRADIHEVMHDTDGALADASEAIRLDPKCWRAYLVRARVFKQLELPGELVELDKAVELSPPRELRALGARAQYLSASGLLKEARLDFDRVIKSGFADAWDFLGRGRLFVQLKMFKEAEQDFESVHNAANAPFRAHQLADEALGELGKPVEASKIP